MNPEICIYQNGDKIIDAISFGISVPGQTKTVVLQVTNEGPIQIYDLKFEIDHEDVKIVRVPKFLDAGKSDEVVLEYTPIKQVDVGLRASLKVEGRYLV